jgi:hypothetical protein
VNVTVTNNTGANSIKLVSVDDTDPNNPVVKYMVTGNVGTVNWGLDGAVTNPLGAPPVGVSTFTVPNIEGLPHSLHILDIIGSNGTNSYADSTTLNTSTLSDQTFANTWQILVTSLPFEDFPHNNLTVNGNIHRSQVLWGIPGQYWDRFISSVSVVTNSLLPADAPNEFRTSAAPALQVGGKYLMSEVFSLGTNTFWGAAFGDGNGGPRMIDIFSKSGLPANFTISGMTCVKGNNLYWSCATWLFATLPNVDTGTLPLTVN